ncbi:MAG: hypothetical protein Q8M29_05785 [Bacteroidota bacterium]|nr:hypothetical protein [Bacteroidota bacterium]
MGKSVKSKGIYCLEGLWDHSNIQDKTSVQPVLELLKRTGHCDYMYHDCATREELDFFLKKWQSKKINSKFPILYLAFHGEEGCIFVENNSRYTLLELAEILADQCMGKVIYFGSCSTLNIDKRKIKSFLQKTKAIAAIGYKIEIDWIQSTACDLFVFEALQQDKLDSQGINKIHKKIVHDYGDLHKKLDLRIVVNDRQNFPRKRNT